MRVGGKVTPEVFNQGLGNGGGGGVDGGNRGAVSGAWKTDGREKSARTFFRCHSLLN